jgi:CMP-N-acetylneuraminic acid synthetase
MSRRKIVALLPMKANSERVRGKNFRTFAGKPLYRWILDTLLSIEEIDAVVINTDARDILAESGLVEQERLVIRDRGPELRGDLVSMNLVLADDVANVPADLYCMTHTTNPLLSADTIRDAISRYRNNLEAGTHDSLFTVQKVQTRFYRTDGSAVNHDPDNLIRTQDLEPWFEENSNLYLFSEASFRSSGARIGKRPCHLVMPKSEALDIDDQESWDMAEAMAMYRMASRAA